MFIQLSRVPLRFARLAHTHSEAVWDCDILQLEPAINGKPFQAIWQRERLFRENHSDRLKTKEPRSFLTLELGRPNWSERDEMQPKWSSVNQPATEEPPTVAAVLYQLGYCSIIRTSEEIHDDKMCSFNSHDGDNDDDGGGDHHHHYYHEPRNIFAVGRQTSFQLECLTGCL